MTNKDDVVDDAQYAQVPVDFPRPTHHGAVPGAHPKLLMDRVQGPFLRTGLHSAGAIPTLGCL